MFEAFLCNSISVLIMSYFLDLNHRYTLIKGQDVQGIKMCSCSCIIIQPYAFQITPHSLDVRHSHHWAATFHKSNQTSFFFSVLQSVIVTDDDMMNDNHWDRVHFDYNNLNYSVQKKKKQLFKDWQYIYWSAVCSGRIKVWRIGCDMEDEIKLLWHMLRFA